MRISAMFAATMREMFVYRQFEYAWRGSSYTCLDIEFQDHRNLYPAFLQLKSPDFLLVDSHFLICFENFLEVDVKAGSRILCASSTDVPHY